MKRIFILATILFLQLAVSAARAANLETYVYGFTNGSEIWIQLNQPESDRILRKDSAGRFHILFEGQITATPHFTGSDRPVPSRKNPIRTIEQDPKSAGLVIGLQNELYLITEQGSSFQLQTQDDQVSRAEVRALETTQVTQGKIKWISKYAVALAEGDQADSLNRLVVLSTAERTRENLVVPSLKELRVETSGSPELPWRIIGTKIFISAEAPTPQEGGQHAKALSEPVSLDADYSIDPKAMAPQSRPNAGARTQLVTEFAGNAEIRYTIDEKGTAQVDILEDAEWARKYEGLIDFVTLRDRHAIIPNFLQFPVNISVIGDAEPFVTFSTPNGLRIYDSSGTATVLPAAKTGEPVAAIRAALLFPYNNVELVSIWRDGNPAVEQLVGRGETYLVTKRGVKLLFNQALALGSGLVVPVINDEGKIQFFDGRTSTDVPEIEPFDLSQVGINIATKAKPGTEKSEKSNLPVPVSVPVPAKTSSDPSQELSAIADRLDRLEQRMNEGIIGQETATKSMTDAITSHLINPQESKRPISFFVIGASGHGKTEFGKVIAESYYQSKDRVRVIPLGGVKSNMELANIMGAGKGYMGSDKPGQFEQALMDMPEGGVIILDEASNMGAGDRQEASLKAGFFKSFYNWSEEGTFTSSQGTTYDLSKYILLYTGNDAEKLFHGTNSETKIQEIYQENSKRENVRELLLSSGVPSAFVNRMDDLILIKPLTSNEMHTVTRTKFLEPLLKSFEENYGIKIDYEKGFVEGLVNNFYSAWDGARGVRRITANYVSAILGKALIPFLKSPKQLPRVKLALRLVEKTNPAKVLLQVDTSEAGSEKKTTLDLDVTEFARTDRFLGLDTSGNPIENDALLDRLQNFQTRLGGRLIGQNAVVEAVSDAVLAHFMNPALKKKPLSLFVVGTTGTGKTELGRSIADSLFGSDQDSFVQVISLGKLKSNADLNNIFGSQRGYVDSEKYGDLEEALRKMRNGGVLVFDEASNMGGGDITAKESLFKAFYELREEGKWKSPLSGITYDLSNYVMLYTGNDGEKVFQKFSSDDMRVAVYNDFKSRTAVQKLLVEAGVPEPFLGRQDFVGMMRPLTQKEMQVITRDKFLEPALRAYKQSFNGVEFEYDENFVRKLTRTFYTHEQGARSIRSAIDNQLGAAITLILTRFRGKTDELKGLKIRLALEDNASSRNYHRGENYPERKVDLVLKYGDQEYRKDVTQLAPQKDYVNYEDARAIAFHEAGHAVAHDEKISRERLAQILLEGPDGSYARYESLGPTMPTRTWVVHKMARLMAGQMGSMMAGYDKNTGWGIDVKKGDLGKIRKHGSDFLIRDGMVSGLAGVQIDKDGNPILNGKQAELFEREMKKLLREAFSEAKSRLEKEWPLVRAVAANLLKKGAIEAKDFQRMRASSAGRSVSEKQAFRELSLQDLFEDIKDEPRAETTRRGRDLEAPKPLRASNCESLFGLTLSAY